MLFGIIYYEFLSNRSDVMSKLLRARVGRFTDLVLRGRANPVLLDPEICLDLFWPSGMPSRFEDLAIKTIVVATNYLDRNEVTYDAGPLRPAVAGSMAIPGLFRPVIFRDEVLVRSPTLDRRKVEFSGVSHVGGLGAPAGVMRETGGLLPIAPCGRTSL